MNTKSLSRVRPSQYVTKSNVLVEARYQLSEQEQKLILIVSSLLDPEKEDSFRLFRLYVSDVIEALGIRGHNKYSQLRQVAGGLLGKKLYIRRDNSELDINWVSSCEYFPGKGYVELEFSRKLIPYLVDLKKKFTAYQLGNILQLKGIYSIRLYELLKQYESLKRRVFEVDELKRLLMIPANSSYKDFGLFRTNVIKPALAEINSKTDIRVTFRGIRTGRKFGRIEFTISPQKKNRPKPAQIEFTQEPADTVEVKSFKEQKEHQKFLKRRVVEEERKRDSSKLVQIETQFPEYLKEKSTVAFQSFQREGMQSKLVQNIFHEFKVYRLLSTEEQDFEIWRQNKKTTRVSNPLC